MPKLNQWTSVRLWNVSDLPRVRGELLKHSLNTGSRELLLNGPGMKLRKLLHAAAGKTAVAKSLPALAPIQVVDPGANRVDPFLDVVNSFTGLLLSEV